MGSKSSLATLLALSSPILSSSPQPPHLPTPTPGSIFCSILSSNKKDQNSRPPGRFVIFREHTWCSLCSQTLRPSQLACVAPSWRDAAPGRSPGSTEGRWGGVEFLALGIPSLTVGPQPQQGVSGTVAGTGHFCLCCGHHGQARPQLGKGPRVTRS